MLGKRHVDPNNLLPPTPMVKRLKKDFLEPDPDFLPLQARDNNCSDSRGSGSESHPWFGIIDESKPESSTANETPADFLALLTNSKDDR